MFEKDKYTQFLDKHPGFACIYGYGKASFGISTLFNVIQYTFQQFERANMDTSSYANVIADTLAVDIHPLAGAAAGAAILLMYEGCREIHNAWEPLKYKIRAKRKMKADAKSYRRSIEFSETLYENLVGDSSVDMKKKFPEYFTKKVKIAKNPYINPQLVQLEKGVFAVAERKGDVEFMLEKWRENEK